MIGLKIRQWLVGIVLLTACAGTLWARQATVVTNDGRRLTGEVVADTPDSVTLLIANIRTPIARADIARVEYHKTLQEQYEERRAELADEDVAGRYELGRWLFEQDAYDLALKELEQLDKQYPEHPENAKVRLLIRVINERKKLVPQPETPAPEPTPATPEQDTSASTTPRPRQATEDLDARLTDEQINLIRVYEIDLSSRPPVIVPREVEERIFSEYADNELTPKGREQATFRSWPGWRKLDLLFKLRARPLYSEVRVTQDPAAMIEFRKSIHQNYVLNYCGSTQCHGGDQAAEMVFFKRESNDPRTFYTNFFILDQYETDRGRMIDRDQPARSLLLQYGMPRSAASTPHPQVANMRPAFRLEYAQDPMYQTILTWIDRGLYAPKPDYQIRYTPPRPAGRQDTGEASVEPAAEQQSQPAAAGESGNP